MSRVRTIYNNLALLAGPAPATGSHSAGINQLERIQSLNWGVNIPQTDVNVYGKLSRIGRMSLESPTVNLDFSYLVTDMANEKKLGFSVNGGVSALSNILAKIGDDRNYFILVAEEGQDAIGKTGADGAVIGIGNGFMTSYKTQGAVGGFPTTSITVEALNICGYADGVGESIPAVNPSDGTQVTGTTFTIGTITGPITGQSIALKPGDISVDIAADAGLLEDLSAIPIQSYNISFDLSRENIQKLGTKHSFSREIKFPVEVKVSIDALAGEVYTGCLSDVICNQTGHDITITLRQPSCIGTGDVAAQYKIKNAILSDGNWTSSIGPNQTVTFNWSSQIGASGDTTDGLFFSGFTGYAGGTGLL